MKKWETNNRTRQKRLILEIASSTQCKKGTMAHQAVVVVNQINKIRDSLNKYRIPQTRAGKKRA